MLIKKKKMTVVVTGKQKWEVDLVAPTELTV